MSAASQHYSALFEALEADIGPLEGKTSTGIVGFSAGGPVSIRRIAGSKGFVSCELSLYDEQIPSAEHENFEMFTRESLTEAQTRALFTALGNLPMDVKLGHGHTVDVTGVSGVGALTVVRLSHYSSGVIDGRRFGVYEVRAQGTRN